MSNDAYIYNIAFVLKPHTNMNVHILTLKQIQISDPTSSHRTNAEHQHQCLSAAPLLSTMLPSHPWHSSAGLHKTNSMSQKIVDIVSCVELLCFSTNSALSKHHVTNDLCSSGKSALCDGLRCLYRTSSLEYLACTHMSSSSTIETGMVIAS